MYDHRPQTEIARKLYRQATNKIAGISDEAAKLLRTYFQEAATIDHRTSGVTPPQ